jgi:hypothetical protein
MKPSLRNSLLQTRSTFSTHLNIHSNNQYCNYRKVPYLRCKQVYWWLNLHRFKLRSWNKLCTRNGRCAVLVLYALPPTGARGNQSSVKVTVSKTSSYFNALDVTLIRTDHEADRQTGNCRRRTAKRVGQSTVAWVSFNSRLLWMAS